MMSVDETLLCSFQVCSSLTSINYLFLKFQPLTDPETSREKGEVCIRRDGIWSTGYSSKETEKERREALDVHLYFHQI
jgi:hypothetical protein